MIVVCDYCGKPATLHLTSGHLYRGRDYGPVWECEPCGAWVGTHKNSPKHAPLGRLANAELRSAKQAAHAAFDPIWKAKMKAGYSKQAARRWGYKWLASRMGIGNVFEDCHIGKFDLDQCRSVVRVVNEFLNTEFTNSNNPTN